MKTLLTLLLAASLMSNNSVSAKPHPGNGTMKKDTMSMKCLLYSADLFYGIELGEKPVRDMVDTLVGEVSYFDSTSKLNLVILSGRDLGFKKQTGILWDQILDSAENLGYSLCPPQVAPELYVISHNLPSAYNPIKQRISGGRPVFVGMERIRHEVAKKKSFWSFLKAKSFFDYVFCIKTGKKGNYALGYSATNGVKEAKNFGWGKDDMFIFVNNPHVYEGNVQQLCNN